MSDKKTEKNIEKKIEKKIEKGLESCCGGNKNMKASASDAVYGLGLVGALVYFLQNAESFKEVIFGIGKAIVWPAFVIYRLLELLKF